MKEIIPFLGRLGLDRAAAGHGLRLAFAAWLAFAIAAGLHVQNAYWAAMPVWVVAQSTRGLLLERAFFRVVGTLIGAGVGLAILQAGGSPYLQLVIVSGWIALCAALTHILRGVHAYGALMSGITAAVVLMPAVLGRNSSLAPTVARVECTLIGVCVVTVVLGLFTPGSERQAFYRRVRRLAGDAVDFAASALRGDETDETERKILAEISEVEASAGLVSAGSLEGYRRLHDVRGLVVASLAVMAAARALHDRQRRSGGATRELPDALSALAASLRDVSTGPIQEAPWSELQKHVVRDSTRLEGALLHLRRADAALLGLPLSADATSFGKKAVYLAPHHDWLLARRTGLACGIGTLIVATVGFASGWSSSQLVALGVAIFLMVLSEAPLPQLIAPKLLMGVVAGVVTGSCYRLGIQPHLETTAELVLSVLPFIVVVSLARATRRIAISGLEAAMCFMLVSQAGMPPTGISEVLNGGVALILGATLVAGGFMLMPRRPDRQAKEVAQLIRRDLVRLTAHEDGPPEEWHSHAARQILRLMIHLGRAGERGEAAPRGLLSALNFGQAASDLRTLLGRDNLAVDERAELVQALRVFGKFEEDPTGAARQLDELARVSIHPRSVETIHDAAAALRASGGLFAFGSGQESLGKPAKPTGAIC